MGRRVRHLNPGSAGAVLALDSRFITGLSDGDPVSTWADRSGNGNDPTINTAFTYKTGILNNLPVVRTIISQNAFMTLRNYSALTSATMLIMFKNALNGNHIFQLTQTSNDPKTYIPFSQGGTYDSFFSTVRKNNFNSGITTQWNIYCVRSTSGEWTAHTNGDLKYNTTTNIVSAPTAGTIGRTSAAGGTSWGDSNGGDIAEIIIFAAALSGSLRRRIEHSAAYSFKIQCK